MPKQDFNKEYITIDIQSGDSNQQNSKNSDYASQIVKNNPSQVLDVDSLDNLSFKSTIKEFQSDKQSRTSEKPNSLSDKEQSIMTFHTSNKALSYVTGNKKSIKSNNNSDDDEDSLEEYQNSLFKSIPKIVDLEKNIQWSQSDNGSLNLELIKRQIKRQQKLDKKRKQEEKNALNQLLKLQPRRKNTRKLQKRQKVVSRKTLQLLAKKFDDYYAYEHNPNHKGSKMSLRQIGQIFDIGANTIHKLYTQWMDDSTFYQRIIRYDLHKRTPQRKLTVQRLQHVARLIKQNPFLTQNQICVQLNRIQDLKSIKDGVKQQINKTVVSRLLKVGKYRKKRVRCVPKERNTTKSLERRYEYCTKYKQLVDRQAKIFFLDQSGFNLYMTRQKAWARPNQQITVNCPISKGKRFSLIAIIGQDGVANWRIIEGTYRKWQYLDFLKQLFERFKQVPELQNEQTWLIMDNCAIHDKQQTKKLAQKFGVKVMYLPAYSPQLNPIQMWFHEIKTKIRKANYTGQNQLMQIMKRTLKQYQDHDFSNYYHGSIKFVEKGIRKQKF